MPMFPPDLSEVLTSLQRQIDQINTARPGPMSWGPDDGHTRFYGPDGTTVLFEAVGGTGASVVSRGALTGMTPLLDSIRDTDDAQNGRLNDQHGWIEGLGTRMGSAEGKLGTAEGRLDGHDGTLASHNTRISTAQSAANGANNRAGALEGRATALEGTASSHNTRISTAQSRADSAWNLANGKASTSSVTTAQNRADSAYGIATGAADNAAALRSQMRNWIAQAIVALENDAGHEIPGLPGNIPA